MDIKIETTEKEQLKEQETKNIAGGASPNDIPKEPYFKE